MLDIVVVGLAGLVVFLVALIILWIVVSLPVYFASKLVRAKGAGLGSAMVATLAGYVVFLIVYALVALVLQAAGTHTLAFAVGFLLAFLAWIGVYKAVFGTGWLGAFAIAILAALIYFVLDAIFLSVFSVSFPGARFLPIHFLRVGAIKL